MLTLTRLRNHAYAYLPTQHSSVLQDYLEAMGPVGPLICIAVVAAAEMVPLAPTPPLTVASGLAFGAVKVLHGRQSSAFSELHYISLTDTCMSVCHAGIGMLPGGRKHCCPTCFYFGSNIWQALGDQVGKA